MKEIKLNKAERYPSKTSSIQILPERIIDKIAAGEVIERPASIVKELLENAVDASSNQITVSIRNGGKSLIKISDNGIGMTHDDALLSFERHATSKISTLQDMNSIETYGFRGEALSSIASISRLKIISKTEPDEMGTEIFIEGGKIRDVKKVATATGTGVEVSQIFFNTPARKKFLKGDTAEMIRVSQAFQTISLAYPKIHFRLNNYDKEIINTPASGDLNARIGDVFGKELVKALIPVSSDSKFMKLSGYISNPVFSRSDRQNQFFYVNNRHIKDKTINHAIYEAYRTLLPKNRHPVLFLFFNIPTGEVDVNVHPAKTEVRFVNQRMVHDFIYYAIQKILLQYKNKRPNDIFQINAASQDAEPDFSRFEKPEDLINYPNRSMSCSFEHNEKEILHNPTPEFDGNLNLNMPSPTPLSFPFYSKCRPVGQIENSFIVLESPSSMVLVDQHTAHERILFEKLEKEFHQSKIIAQQLLFPVSVELSHKESTILESHLDDIKKLGLEIECFGKRSFIIRSVPSILEGKDYSALILEIVDILSKFEKIGPLEQIFTETLKIMACHGAIRANQRLENEEIQNLLLALEKTKLPYTCPHGRPIALVYTLKDIKKKFLRT